MAGNFDYDRKKKKIQSSVGGKLAVFLLWREIFITTGKKKDTLRLEKKDTRLRPEKKVTVVCLASCAVVSVFGSDNYDRKKKKLQSSVWRVMLLCQFLVLAITTGKQKSYSTF